MCNLAIEIDSKNAKAFINKGSNLISFSINRFFASVFIIILRINRHV